MNERADAPAPGSRVHVRPLLTADLDDLFRIQTESCDPAYRESEAAVLAKLALFRAGALGWFDGDALCGYAFALPWRAGTVIPVAHVLEALPERPDVMYIHDMVVAPAHRGRGVASALLAEISRLAVALDLDRLSLVAVQGSEPFWQRSGFAAAERVEYVPGVTATRMERPAAARPSPPSNIPDSGEHTE